THELDPRPSRLAQPCARSPSAWRLTYPRTRSPARPAIHVPANAIPNPARLLAAVGTVPSPRRNSRGRRRIHPVPTRSPAAYPAPRVRVFHGPPTSASPRGHARLHTAIQAEVDLIFVTFLAAPQGRHWRMISRRAAKTPGHEQ